MTHYTQYLNHHVTLLYLNHHVTLLNEFKKLCEQEYPFNDKPLKDEDHTVFLETLSTLCALKKYSDGTNEKGQWLISRIVSAYSHLMPEVPRDLLWFFGGDCLHYMPDEEIAFYQQLDELRFTAEESGKPFDIKEAKRTLATLN